MNVIKSDINAVFVLVHILNTLYKRYETVVFEQRYETAYQSIRLLVARKEECICPECKSLLSTGT